LDFHKREITLSATAIICFKIKRLRRVTTREITEFPDVFLSAYKRRATIDATCLIEVKEIVKLTREITIFFSI